MQDILRMCFMILELNPVTVSDHYEDYKKLFPISVNCEIQVYLRHRVLR